VTVMHYLQTDGSLERRKMFWRDVILLATLDRIAIGSILRSNWSF